MHRSNNNSLFLKGIFIYILALILALCFLSVIVKLNTNLILSDLWKSQFWPDKNTHIFQSISTINPLILHYFIAYFSLLILCILTKIKNENIFGNKSLAKDFRIQILLITSVLLASQSFIQFKYYEYEMSKHYNKTTEQKISLRFNKAYHFAEYAKEQLPGKYFCQPVTNIHKKPYKGLLTYLAVQYYLYPLDIVTHEIHADFDCMIIMRMDNPENLVPPTFKASPAFDEKSLIAIKKDIIRD